MKKLSEKMKTCNPKNIRRRGSFYILLVVLALSIILPFKFLRSAYVVPVLMYHSVDDKWRESKLSVSPESFERQMEFLVRNRYNILSLHELTRLLESGKPIKPKTVAITFDDGYENNYTNAFPVLKRYGIPATVFVVIDKIGRKGYLTWKQIREMAAHNIEIGSHTMSECYLPDIDERERLIKEISGSRQALKRKIPGSGDFIAYCSGGFNDDIRQIVIDSGYDGACATNPGKAYPADDIYALKRLRISRTSDNLFVFWIETSGLYTWIKEHRDED